MKKDEAQAASAESRLQKTVRSSKLFARRILGVRLWGGQEQILESIQSNRRTAIRSCHSSGKTFVLAVAALWWLSRYPDGVVLTTSPTYRQVKSQLWLEIHRVARQARFSIPKGNLTELRMRDENNFALGVSTSHGVNFQGFHGGHVLIVVDEAPGVDSEIYAAVAGIMASGTVHVVLAGNPTVRAGPFFDAFNRERSLWKCIKLDAFDTPNLAGVNLEALLQMDPAPGGPLDQNPFKHLVSRRWVYEQAKVWWRGDEQNSPEWMSRVRAEFPSDSHNALIRLSWLERARDVPEKLARMNNGRLVAGVDVGGGRSETVVYLCETTLAGHKIVGLGAWRGEDTRGEVLAFLRPYQNRLVSVRVDSVGIGHGFALHLRDQKLPVEMINVGLPCVSEPSLRESDPVLRFVNQKAQFYQNLADAFERGQIFGLTDDVTFEQLAGLLFEVDPRGRVKIEPKEQALRRGISSPDRAEALMLAVGKEFRRQLPGWMVPELAQIHYREGETIAEIAKHLQATEGEVKTWIRNEAAKLGASRICFWCYLPLRPEPAVRCGEWHYHTECYPKFISGEQSPIAPSWNV
jgi:hypothetical protein